MSGAPVIQVGKNASSAFSWTSRSLELGGMAWRRSGTGEPTYNLSHGSLEPAHVQHFYLFSPDVFLGTVFPLVVAAVFANSSVASSCLVPTLSTTWVVRTAGETRTRQCIQNVECSLTLSQVDGERAALSVAASKAA